MVRRQVVTMVTSLRTFLTEEKVLEAAGAGYFARI